MTNEKLNEAYRMRLRGYGLRVDGRVEDAELYLAYLEENDLLEY